MEAAWDKLIVGDSCRQKWQVIKEGGRETEKERERRRRTERERDRD